MLLVWWIRHRNDGRRTVVLQSTYSTVCANVKGTTWDYGKWQVGWRKQRGVRPESLGMPRCTHACRGWGWLMALGMVEREWKQTSETPAQGKTRDTSCQHASARQSQGDGKEKRPISLSHGAQHIRRLAPRARPSPATRPPQPSFFTLASATTSVHSSSLVHSSSFLILPFVSSLLAFLHLPSPPPLQHSGSNPPPPVTMASQGMSWEAPAQQQRYAAVPGFNNGQSGNTTPGFDENHGEYSASRFSCEERMREAGGVSFSSLWISLCWREGSCVLFSTWGSVCFAVQSVHLACVQGENAGPAASPLPFILAQVVMVSGLLLQNAFFLVTARARHACPVGHGFVLAARSDLRSSSHPHTPMAHHGSALLLVHDPRPQLRHLKWALFSLSARGHMLAAGIGGQRALPEARARSRRGEGSKATGVGHIPIVRPTRSHDRSRARATSA